MSTQYIEIDEEGNKFYYKDKEMAILHREEGPAIEWTNGKFHREDGPAIEHPNGYKSWYLNGVKLTEEEFKMKTAKEIVLTLDEIAARFGVDASQLKISK